MRFPAHLARRSLAVGLIAVLAAPLLGALHQHEVDHDGATHHIEAAHGTHAPSLSESDSRLGSGPLKLLLGALSSSSPELPEALSVLSDAAGRDETEPQTRAPPGALRSRAPPA